MIDRSSPTWRRLRKHLDLRIAGLQRQNEYPISPDETAMIRGQIKEARALIAHVEPKNEPAAFAPEKDAGPLY